MSSIRRSFRWLLIPVAAFLATDTRVGLTYAIAAFLFVGAALIAPTRRALTAIVLYACGAALAWSQLNDWYFPEGHPRGYQPSRVPLVLTLLGGIVGVLAVVVYDPSIRRQIAIYPAI